jgi:hypothetical protein
MHRVFVLMVVCVMMGYICCCVVVGMVVGTVVVDCDVSSGLLVFSCHHMSFVLLFDLI